MPSLDDALTSMVSMCGRSVGLRPLNRPDFALLYAGVETATAISAQDELRLRRQNVALVLRRR